MIAEQFAQQGLTPTIEIVDPDSLQAALEKAAHAPAIIIGGGDGTVRTAVEYLAGKDTLLGVLPLGTLNHFAKDLGMPANLEDAIAFLCSGEVKKIDVGEVNGHIFINNTSLGIYPLAVLLRQKIADRLDFPKYVAMAWGFLKLFSRFPMLSLHIAQKTVYTPLVFIGNNVYEKNPFQNAKRTALDQGVLDVAYLSTKTRLDFLWATFRGLIGRFEDVEHLEKLEMTELRIFSRRKRIYIALDGEVKKIDTPLYFRTRPKSLNVIAPRS